MIIGGENQYQIILKDAVGNVLIPKIDAYTSLEYTRSVNNVGALTMILADQTPAGVSTIAQLQDYAKYFIDGRIEVWRSVAGRSLYLDWESLYFIRKPERDLSEDLKNTFTMNGEDTISLLNRRTTNVDPKSALSNISTATAADDALKAIFTNYLGTSAGAGFDLSAYISVQENLTKAPTITKQFPGRYVGDVMREICQTSADLGTYLAFDIVSDGDTFQFRTYINQRGFDRRGSTGNALLVGPDVGNVLSCHFEDDHTKEATWIVNGTQHANSDTREAISPFGRIMKVMSSSATGTAAQLTADAQAQLRFNRSKRLFTAKMIQSPGCLYGVHYGFGDFVTVSNLGQQYDCHLDGVDITIVDGKETVNCIFRGEYQAWL